MPSNGDVESSAATRRKGSRFERERLSGGNLCCGVNGVRVRVTEFTGEHITIDVPGGVEVVERTETWIECGNCGRMFDA